MLAQDVAPRFVDAPTPATAKQLETISISIGLGAQGRSSSIVLPREHDLVRHLERLLPAIAASSPSSDRQEAVNALTSMGQPQLRQPQLHHQPQRSPIGSMSQYIRANSRYETSSYLPPQTVYVPAVQATGSPVFRATQQQPHQAAYMSAPEPRLTATRRRRGASGNGKKCQIAGCDKISVSRGLCRGHGGGRRCQHAGCTKGAQSRSDFCWAHGGGQRCEVKGCMRSRKSKRFCVAHLSWENAPLAPSAQVVGAVQPLSPPARAQDLPPITQENHPLYGSRTLPSLRQALAQASSPVRQ